MRKFREEVYTSAGMLFGSDPSWQSWGEIGNDGDPEEAIKQCKTRLSHSSNKCPRRVVEIHEGGSRTVIYNTHR